VQEFVKLPSQARGLQPLTRRPPDDDEQQLLDEIDRLIREQGDDWYVRIADRPESPNVLGVS